MTEIRYLTELTTLDEDYFVPIQLADGTTRRIKISTLLGTGGGGGSDPSFASVGALFLFNGGIVDSSSNSLVPTIVGNAQASATSPIFGTGSLVLDGTGDEVILPSNTAIDCGTGDFTFEISFIPNSLSGTNNLFKAPGSSATGFEYGSAGLSIWLDGTGAILASASLTVSTLYHVGLKRSGSAMSLWLNGTQQASVTNTSAWNFSDWRIGRNAYNNDANAKIDNFRITKGVARDLSVPPTDNFPTN